MLRSGFCPNTSIYYSKREPATLPSDEFVDLPSFLSSQPHEGQIVLIDSATNQKMKFPQLWRTVRSVAAGLAEMGLKKGDVVLLLSPNSIHFPVICMAIMSLGAVVTTTNPLNTAKEIEKQARDSKAILAFVTPNLADKLAETRLPLVLILAEPKETIAAKNRFLSLWELMGSNPAKMPEVKISQDDTAALLYSSGTTGMSKGVVCTHGNLISMACIFLKRLELNGESQSHEIYLCTVPMCHIYGFGVFTCALLASGATIVVLPRFDQKHLEHMLECIEKYRVSRLPLVPPVLVALTKTEVARKYDLSCLRAVLCGGAPLSKESTEEFISMFPRVSLLQGYGLTETMGMGASSETPEESKHYGTAGLLAPNTEAKVVDPDFGRALPPNERGELWIRGPIVMKGYFSNPEATSSAKDEDGWLHTGDLCYIDAEGYLFIVDRMKELIKYKGYQVAPAELEALLLSHPEIADVAVVPFPDKEAGQVPMAYVVRRQGSSLSEASVIDFVAKQVAPYKKVRRVAFVSGIPKTAAGKILRKDLIKLSTSRL